MFRKFHRLLIFIFISLILLPVYSESVQPKPGRWSAKTDFGKFEFTVARYSIMTSITLTFSNWLGRSGSVTDYFNWVIINRRFRFNPTFPYYYDDDQWTFEGIFSETGTTASGDWRLAIFGKIYYGYWAATPLPVDSEPIKIVSWNILNYPGTNGASRDDDFRKVLEELDTDILVVQEMLNQAGVNQFLNNGLNQSFPNTYKAAPFFNGPDKDNALFYKEGILKLISHQQISTAFRDISEYVLEIQEGLSQGTQFRIYSVHLTSGSSPSNKNKREEEARILRDYLNGLPPNSLFLICGTFYMKSSKENAFKILTGNQNDNDGRSKDPTNKKGKWHNKKKFRKIHTQSTRTSKFGKGATGGLDDRYDLILASYGLNKSTKLTYAANSYMAYGNDGKHFNKAINKGKNKSVDKKIANALHEASDHLPVIIELKPPE